MNKLLYSVLLLIFIIFIFKYFMKIEGMLENEKNDTIEKIDDLAAGMTQDYKVFNSETSNMVIQQERLFIILGISSVVLIGITVYYVMNK
jgi:hypothetical protein